MKKKEIVTLAVIFIIVASILAGALYLGNRHRIGGKDPEPHSHEFGEWSVVSEPTCTAHGKQERICSTCDKVEERDLYPLGHRLGDWVLTDETKYVKSCTVCGKDAHIREIPTVATEDARFHLTEDRKSYKLVAIVSDESDVILIPSEYNGLKVTEIGEEVLANCKTIDTLILPDTITKIGVDAFKASSLKSIFIPESVSEIGDSAFMDCKNLESVILPNSVTSIGTDAFARCESLSEVYIPEGVVSIGNGAFGKCSSLREVRLPESATEIEGYTFSSCTSLERITLPKSLTRIPESIFNNCKSLKNIDIPSGVTLLESGCFAGCVSLLEVVIPDNVQKIERSVFTNCQSLRSVVIPEGIITIEYSTFAYCPSLESITIPSTLRSIATTAFIGTGDKLKTVSISPENTTYSTDGRSIFCKQTSGIKKILLGASNGVIPTDAGINEIGVCAFRGRENLTEIFIPKNIVRISDLAFWECPNVQSITYEGTVAEWNAMKRGFDWFSDSDIDVVHCSDGDTKLIVDRAQSAYD